MAMIAICEKCGAEIHRHPTLQRFQERSLRLEALVLVLKTKLEIRLGTQHFPEWRTALLEMIDTALAEEVPE